MEIPKYILDSAREYADSHGGSREIEDAFIAGFESSKKRRKKDVTSTEYEPALFEECWQAYGRKGSRGAALLKWCDLTSEERKKVLPHIRIYVTSREACYRKDFERYLLHRHFNDVIMSNSGTIMYDPSQSENLDEYHPLADGIFNYWDSVNKRLIINHPDVENHDDGYTAENRPEGATIYWNGYSWKWSVEQKKWVKQ